MRILGYAFIVLFAVFLSLLTIGQVQQPINGILNQNVGPVPTCTNALFDWHMNEGTGTSTLDHCGSNNGVFSAGGLAPTWASDGTNLVFTATGNSIIIPSGINTNTINTLVVALKIDHNALQSGPYKALLSTTGAATPFLNINPSTGRPVLFPSGTALTDGVTKMVGWHVWAITFGNPNHIYIDGVEDVGYLAQGTVGLAAGTLGLLGDLQGAAGSNDGFPGNMAWAVAYSDVKSAATIAAISNAIATNLAARGILIGEKTSLPLLIWSGDSITFNSGDSSNLYTSIPYQTLALLPSFPMEIENLGYPGYTLLNNMQFTGPVTGLRHKFNGNSVAFVAYGGTNDIQNNTGTDAQIFSYAQLVFNGTSAGGIQPGVFVTCVSRFVVGANETKRTAFNGDVRTGFLAGTLKASIADAGTDPDIGAQAAYLTTWFTDQVHPSPAGSAVIAAYVAPALQRAIGFGSQGVWIPIRLSNNGNTNWTKSVGYTYTNAQSTTRVANPSGPGPAIAAATSQAIPIYYLGAKYQLCGARLKTITPFSATGLASMTATIGDSVGGNTYYTSTTYDAFAAASNTNEQDNYPGLGLLKVFNTLAGSTVNLVLTANQNLNAQANLAGNLEVDLCINSVP